MKSLIVYGTQVEWTRKIAEIIADTLKKGYNHKVILSDSGISDDNQELVKRSSRKTRFKKSLIE